MKIGEAIKYAENTVEEKEEQAWESQLQGRYEKIVPCLRYADECRQVAKWLRQLQEIQKIVREYRTVPIEVMDSDDAFSRICEVVGE